MVVHLVPIGQTGIPRADAEIARTIKTFRTVQFEQDPLLDASDSFRVSLYNSAIKREGHILEAAIKDAIDQTPHLRLVESVLISRRVDVQFMARARVPPHQFVALEIKRGVQHDSTKLRQFRADLKNIPLMLRAASPVLQTADIAFHIVFVSGIPPLEEGLSLNGLARLYDLHAYSHIQTTRQRYSVAIKAVLKERGL